MNATVGISGIGCVGPWGTDLASLRKPCMPDSAGVRIASTVSPVDGISKNDMRRMSNLTRFTLFAGSRAFAQSGCSAKTTGLFMGLTHGPTKHMVEFHDFLFDYGPDKASPNSFSNGVTNAPLSALSAALKLTCGGTTILGWENNGLDVLSYCAQAVADGTYAACLVGSSEEYSSVVCDAYRACKALGTTAPSHLPMPSQNGNFGFGISEGSAFAMLEPLSNVSNKKPICLFTPLDLNEYTGNADVVISCAAAGRCDARELDALRCIASRNNGKPALVFTKPLFGESFGLGSTLSVLAACDMVSNQAQYPAFPIHPEIADAFFPYANGPIATVLVMAAGRNGRLSAGLICKAEDFGAA